MIKQQPHSIPPLPEVNCSAEQIHVLLHTLLLRQEEPSFLFSLLPFCVLKGEKKTSPGFLAPWWKFTPPLRRYFSFFCFFFSPSCHHSWCLWAALNTSFKCGCPPEELSHPAWTPTLAMWAPWQNRCGIIHCVSGALPASFRHPFFWGGGFSWDGVRQRLDTQSPPEEQQPGSAPFELLLVHYSVFNFLPFAMNNLSFMFPF